MREAVEKIGTIMHCWWERKMVQPFWRRLLESSNLKIGHPMSQQFHSKIYVLKKLKPMCTQTLLHGFIAALFIIDKNRNTPHFHQLMNGDTKCVFYMI